MKAWIKKVFGFGLASFFSDFGHEMTISLVPVLVAQFVSASSIPFFLGIISSLTEAFANFFRLFSGFISDRVSKKKPLIAVGYAFSAVFSSLMGFAHSLWGILFYRMLSYTGSGLREPPRDALIAATVESQNYGRAFGLKSLMDTLGSLVGPLVALACAGVFSIRGIFALSFIPGALAVFAIIFLTKEVVVPRQKKQSQLSLWQGLRLLPRSFVIFFIIILIFDLGFFNKLLLLARAQEILSGYQGNVAPLLILLYAIFNVVRACSEFLIGLISDYVNRIVLLAFLGCGLFAGVAFLLIAPHASLGYCILVFSLAGVSIAAMTTLKKAVLADMLPEQIRGLGYGTLQAGEGFAALISNMLIGFLWSRFSPLWGFSYVIVLSLAAMVLLLMFGEDMILSVIAQERDKKGAKTVTHHDAWK